MWSSQLPAPPLHCPWVPKPTRLLPNKAKEEIQIRPVWYLLTQPWSTLWKRGALVQGMRGASCLYSGSFHRHHYCATSSWGGPRALPASLMAWQLHGSPMAGCPPTGPSCTAHHPPLRCQRQPVTFSSTSCRPDTTYDMNTAKARISFFHTKIKNCKIDLQSVRLL